MILGVSYIIQIKLVKMRQEVKDVHFQHKEYL
jgi:hypothetical protein